MKKNKLFDDSGAHRTPGQSLRRKPRPDVYGTSSAEGAFPLSRVSPNARTTLPGLYDIRMNEPNGTVPEPDAPQPLTRHPTMHTTLGCYAIAVAIITVWSTTFVSTKVLLRSLSPEEIMFCRHILAYLALLAAYPHRHRSSGIREELLFAGAGLFGGTLYFLTENYALKFSMASNVGLLMATAPMLTVLVARFLNANEPFNRQLAVGCGIAFLGVFLVIFNGHFVLKLHPLGDLLAVVAALTWAFYSILVKQIGNRYNGIYITRKIFFYSIVTMLPFLAFGDFRCDFGRLRDPEILLNLLFLGVVASSLCFLVWSKIIWKIGPVAVNNFIYLEPFITMLAAWWLLDEQLTPIAVTGGIVILAGVYISTQAVHKRPRSV